MRKSFKKINCLLGRKCKTDEKQFVKVLSKGNGNCEGIWLELLSFCKADQIDQE